MVIRWLLAGMVAAAGLSPAVAAAPSKPAAPAPFKPTPPSPADANLDLAYGAYQRGLYVTAFREATARIARNRDDAAAMTLLGELFNQGLGVKQSPKDAAEWYQLAARRGDAHAMAALGLMAADGRGLPKNAAQARDWFEKAAAKNEPVACYNLGLLLLNGNEQQVARAAALMRIAASSELADAQYSLGVLYARGLGVDRDPGEAAKWFLRASRNGSLNGTVEYAIALFNGVGTTKNEPIAARFFRHAAIDGNAIAQNRLARLYATGRGVPRNLVEAAAWHLVASGQGLSDSWLDAQLNDLPAQDRKRAEELASDRAGRG